MPKSERNVLTLLANIACMAKVNDSRINLRYSMGKFLFLVSKVQKFKGSKVQCFGFEGFRVQRFNCLRRLRVQGSRV